MTHLAESIVYYRRAMARILEANGILDPKAVTTHAFDSDKKRYEVWIAESIFTAFGEIEKGEWKVALRCALQAAEYSGKLGGFWPGPVVGDAYLVLRNALEDKVSGREPL